MNIKSQLEKEHSKENSLRILTYIGNNSELFHELMECFFMESEDYRVPQRAAYTLSLMFNKQPNLVLPYREKLIKCLQDPKLKSPLKRNILRILQFTEIPEGELGIVYDKVSGFLMNPKEEIAIRAFSMTVLYNITEQFPELKPELRMMIESVMEEPEISPGIRSRGGIVLGKLYRQIS